MTEGAAEARRAYKREWARKNPDKIKAQQQRYWEKKAASSTDTRKAAQDGPQRDNGGCGSDSRNAIRWPG